MIQILLRFDRAKKVGKVVLAGVVGISMICAGMTFCGDLHKITAMVQIPSLLLAASLTLLYRVLNAMNWGLILESIGVKLPTKQAVPIWLTSEACRWLPGSLWSYGSRGFQAKAAGVPGLQATLSLPLELILTIFAWCVTVIVFGTQHVNAVAAVLPQSPGGQTLLTVIPVTVTSLIVGWFVARGLSRRQPQATKYWKMIRGVHPVKRHVLIATLNYCALCGLNGLALFVVIASLQPVQTIPMTAVIAANAAAWLIGFFALFAPGGLLVREGVLATLLACWLPLEVAIAAAVLWRMLQLSVELLCLATVSAVRTTRRICSRRSVFPRAYFLSNSCATSPPEVP